MNVSHSIPSSPAPAVETAARPEALRARLQAQLLQKALQLEVGEETVRQAAQDVGKGQHLDLRV